MSNNASTVWAFLAIATVLLLFLSLFFMIGWNLGVVGLAASCGLVVDTIGFLTAMGAGLFLSTSGVLLGINRSDIGTNKRA